MISTPEEIGCAGALLLFLEIIVAARGSECMPAALGQHQLWRLCMRLALAAVSLICCYPSDGRYIVLGFPFTAAVFEPRGDRLIDFVGPATLPAIAANPMFFQLLPRYFRMRAAFVFTLRFPPVSNSSPCRSAHRPRARIGSSSERPSGVSEYSTRGGASA